MSESSSSEEKEFDPSPRRLQQARDEGRVPLSKDVNSAVQMVIVLLIMLIFGGEIMAWFCNATRDAIIITGQGGGTGNSFITSAGRLFDIIGKPVLALCAVAAISASLTGLFQTGFNVAPKAFGLKFDRLNPLKKIKDLFSPQKLAVNALLSIGKMGTAGLIAWLVLKDDMLAIASLPFQSVNSVVEFLGDRILSLFLWITIVISVLAVLDYLWQRKQLMDNLKMTREELKRERIEEEGQPEIKGRRKAMHREMTMNRVIQEVPTADVIVTNPTHFAIALRYVPGKDKAPVVVAKGADAMAAHIRKIGREYSVPIIEHRPLARTLWRKVKVGRSVPGFLFQAVAEVLARVYRNKNMQKSA